MRLRRKSPLACLRRLEDAVLLAIVFGAHLVVGATTCDVSRGRIPDGSACLGYFNVNSTVVSQGWGFYNLTNTSIQSTSGVTIGTDSIGSITLGARDSISWPASQTNFSLTEDWTMVAWLNLPPAVSKTIFYTVFEDNSDIELIYDLSSYDADDDDDDDDDKKYRGRLRLMQNNKALATIKVSDQSTIVSGWQYISVQFTKSSRKFSVTMNGTSKGSTSNINLSTSSPLYLRRLGTSSSSSSRKSIPGVAQVAFYQSILSSTEISFRQNCRDPLSTNSCQECISVKKGQTCLDAFVTVSPTSCGKGYFLSLNQKVCEPMSSTCQVAGTDVMLENSNDVIGQSGKRTVILVRPSANITSCNVRVAAWEVRYSGYCPLKLQVWKVVDAAAKKYELVGQNSASLSSFREVVRRVEVPMAERINVTQNVVLGLTSTSSYCSLDDYAGTSADTVHYVYNKTTSALSRTIGQVVVFSSFSETGKQPAFRALLEDIDECLEDSHNCSLYSNTACANTIGGFMCNCKHGFAGTAPNGCHDINECLSQNACLSGESCTNTQGSFSCAVTTQPTTAPTTPQPTSEKPTTETFTTVQTTTPQATTAPTTTAALTTKEQPTTSETRIPSTTTIRKTTTSQPTISQTTIPATTKAQPSTLQPTTTPRVTTAQRTTQQLTTPQATTQKPTMTLQTTMPQETTSQMSTTTSAHHPTTQQTTAPLTTSMPTTQQQPTAMPTTTSAPATTLPTTNPATTTPAPTALQTTPAKTTPAPTTLQTTPAKTAPAPNTLQTTPVKTTSAHPTTHVTARTLTTTAQQTTSPQASTAAPSTPSPAAPITTSHLITPTVSPSAAMPTPSIPVEQLTRDKPSSIDGLTVDFSESTSSAVTTSDNTILGQAGSGSSSSAVVIVAALVSVLVVIGVIIAIIVVRRRRQGGGFRRKSSKMKLFSSYKTSTEEVKMQSSHANLCINDGYDNPRYSENVATYLAVEEGREWREPEYQQVEEGDLNQTTAQQKGSASKAHCDGVHSSGGQVMQNLYEIGDDGILHPDEVSNCGVTASRLWPGHSQRGVEGTERHYSELNFDTHKESIYDKLAISVDDEQPYQEPPTSLKALYSHLRKSGYRQLARGDIKLVKQLGSGEFGEVMLAELSSVHTTVPVAVKVLKDKREEARCSLLQEAAIMGQFLHRNVVKLCGVVTEGDPVLIVLELMEKGDLRSYLFKQQPDPGQLVDDTLKSRLLRMAREVASGMAYLSSRSFVHRDLAARNIMVDASLTCKIGDFGMSRNLDNDEYYTSKGGKVPVRWTAPEALLYRKYSPASDVWSYGVVLFEIFSLGKKPYFGCLPQQVIKIVSDQKRRQHPPPGCSKALYQLMIDCWHPDKSSRPTFSDIVRTLRTSKGDLLASPSEGDEQCVIGAPLQTAVNLYSDLQLKYT